MLFHELTFPHLANKFSPSVEPEDSLPCSQERTAGPTLNQINPVQTLQQYFFKIDFNIILPPMAKCSKYFPLHDIRPKQHFLVSRMRAICHTHSTVYMVILIISCEEKTYKLRHFPFCNFLHLVSSSFGSKFSTQHLFPNIIHLCSIFNVFTLRARRKRKGLTFATILLFRIRQAIF